MKKNRIALSVVSFMVMGVLSAAPPIELPVPTALSANVAPDGRVTLAWSPVAGAFSYHLVVMAGRVGSGSTTSFPMKSFNRMAPGSYSFKVKALGNGPFRDSDYSEMFDFIVGEAPACGTPPRINLSVTPTVIWPPNRKMVAVGLSGTILQEPGCTIDSSGFTLQDEYGANQSGPLRVEASGGGFSTTVYVEAWRHGPDIDGRTYTFTVTAANQAGSGISNPAAARVPHDQR